MNPLDVVAPAIAASGALLTALIGGWFAQRVHKLEERVDTLEREQQDDWQFIRKLIDFIYRNKLIPPERD